jgi:MFS family permease
MTVRIVAICFLAQNCAMGLAFGSYGVLLASTESHFGVSRALAAIGSSMITLAMGLLAPVAGTVIQRVPVRAAMIAGAVFSATGYGVLAITDTFPVALAMYALVGIGVVLLAVLGPATIISRWFPATRARMLGIVNLPLVLFLAPFGIAETLPALGRSAVIGGMAGLFILLIPLLALLVERPPVAAAAEVATPGQVAAPAGSIKAAQIVRSPAFWLLSIAIGVMSGSGGAFMVHFIPYLTQSSHSLRFASSALSAYSGAGFFGILFFSWLADRIGTTITLALVACGQAVAWFALLHVEGAGIFLFAAMLGFCINAVVTLHGATLGDLFGTENVGKTMGYGYMVKLPFLFGFAPVFGWAFDTTGNYTAAFFTTSLMLAGAGVLAYFLWMTVRMPREPVPS